MNYLEEKKEDWEDEKDEEDFMLFEELEEDEEFQMPWCVTCGQPLVEERFRKAGPIERRKAMDFPDHRFKIVGFSHQRISFIQYLKCKRKGHDCYFW